MKSLPLMQILGWNLGPQRSRSASIPVPACLGFALAMASAVLLMAAAPAHLGTQQSGSPDGRASSDVAFALESPVLTVGGSQTYTVTPGMIMQSDDESVVASIYHADFGLVVVSAARLDDSNAAGDFVDGEAILEWRGTQIRIRSTAGRPIFASGDRPAFARVTPSAELSDMFRSGPNSWIAAGRVQGPAAMPAPPPAPPANPMALLDDLLPHQQQASSDPDLTHPGSSPTHPGPPPPYPGPAPLHPGAAPSVPSAGDVSGSTWNLVRPRVSVDGRDTGVIANALTASHGIALYLPDIGVVMVSLRPFDGSEALGTVTGTRLQVSVGGRRVVVLSESAITASPSAVQVRVLAADVVTATIGSFDADRIQRGR